jgi:hypothetical protein
MQYLPQPPQPPQPPSPTAPRLHPALAFVAGFGAVLVIALVCSAVMFVLTGNQSGEIPPFFGYLMLLGCAQALWVVPIAIATAVTRRWAMFLGVIAGAVLVLLASLGLGAAFSGIAV